MKKKILSLALALAMCLGLTIPAFAAANVGDTTLVDANGTVYRLSNPIVGIEPLEEYMIASGAIGEPIVYLVPFGTNVMPVMPEGFSLGADSAYGMLIYEKGDHNINFFNGTGWYSEGGYGSMGLEGTDIDAQSVLLIRSRYLKGSWDDCTESALYFRGVDAPEQSTTPDVMVEDIPASGTAYASTQTVTVDGKAVEFQMYALKDANGNDTNYIKLRDLAYVLNGTAAQFSVGYDGTISLTTGEAYQAAGTEMTTPYSGDRAYTGGAQTVKLDGQDVSMTAITLTDGNGGGYTYFKLRDLGAALGFNVGWSQEAGVFVESDQPYAG